LRIAVIACAAPGTRRAVEYSTLVPVIQPHTTSPAAVSLSRRIVAGVPITVAAAAVPRLHSSLVISSGISGMPGACRAASWASATYFVGVAAGPSTLYSRSLNRKTANLLVTKPPCPTAIGCDGCPLVAAYAFCAAVRSALVAGKAEMPRRSTGPVGLVLRASWQMSYVGRPISAGTAFGWIVTTGTARVVCTSVWSIRTHKVSATLAGSLGVGDGVSEGVSVGVVLTDTSGGTFGAVSFPGLLQPARANTTRNAATGRIRMVTRL